MVETEKWKVIPEFDLYEISNKGQVRSKDRIITNGVGTFVKKGRILKPQDNGTGHMRRAKRTLKWIEHLHKSQAKTYVPVIGTNIETGEDIYFEKLNDVALQGFQPSCVSNCCKGKREQHKGYRWKYGQ